eukprot:scaffold57260_cov48-Attheya_sp.AAC.3
MGRQNKNIEILKEQAQQIIEKHNGMVPSVYEDLIQLKGVGPKIANILLYDAFGIDNGIAVDVHVHRMKYAPPGGKAEYAPPGGKAGSNVFMALGKGTVTEGNMGANTTLVATDNVLTKSSRSV